MGNICDRTSSRSKNPLEGRIPSVSLFEELGVPLISRPSVEELHNLWGKCYQNENNYVNRSFLKRHEFHDFLRSLHSTWGKGKWKFDPIFSAKINPSEGKVANNDDDSISSSNLSLNLLRKELVEWNDALLCFWGPPVGKIPSSVVILLQRKYLNAQENNQHINSSSKGARYDLTPERAGTLAKEILASVNVNRRKRKTVSRRVQSNCETFDDFVQEVGPTYAKFSNTKTGIHHSKGDGALPLDGKIRSFSPIRESTCQILNCGEAVMTAMLYAIKGATTEIMMSWWEFCVTLPAIRNAKLGNDSWKEETGVLLSVLKKKADEGCKVYILLYNRINVIEKTAQSVEYAKHILGDHPNIHVIAHPGITVWTVSNHQKFIVVDRSISILGGVDWTVGRWDNPSHPIFDFDSSVHPGLDIRESAFKTNVSEWWNSPDKDLKQWDRKESTVKPWQDVSILVRGLSANDVAINFIERWDFIRNEFFELVEDGFRDSMPTIPSTIKLPSGTTYEAYHSVVSSLTVGGYPSQNSSQNCYCQIVRSLGDWSGGLKKSEISHYQAWISAINSARKYICIEQQYFTSRMGEKHVKNRVGEAILNRAVAAIDQGRAFQIYIVVPERLPSVMSYYTRVSLIEDNQPHEELCLMSRIELALKTAKPETYWNGKKADDMMIVCTLSGVGKSLSGRWDTSDIYLHSKVLLVDDTVAVIGSANANDRSFEGNHDSELGAIIWADSDEQSTNGLIKDFRLRLWRQFLGLDKYGTEDSCIIDPSSKKTFQLWKNTATRNQTLLASVFNFTPRNSITCFADYKYRNIKYQDMSPQEKKESLNDPDRLEEFKGQIVLYPPKFLSDQKHDGLITDMTKVIPIFQEQFI